jgi:phosphoribosylanthranilate isomerase
MWVKICGITRHEDAVTARDLGADALGFVFTRSPRRVDRAWVEPWIGSVGGVEKVAVFTDEGADEILRTCEGLGIDTLQLHAAPSPEHEGLARRFRIIYAMREYDPGLMPGFACRILIDASRGTGERSPWVERCFPYILAGGLNPDNVREAILAGRPAGVDVSSGVESAPGIKDPLKVERFIQEAKT